MKILAKYGWVFLGLLLVLFCVPDAMAQCSICTKTAAELGPESAKGLNAGILYLAAVPFALGGIIGYRWWKSNSLAEEDEADLPV